MKNDTMKAQLSPLLHRQRYDDAREDRVESALDRRENQEPQEKKKKKKELLNLPHVTQWDGDDIDHINIYQQGVTDLGRVLHPTSRLEFVHDVFGPFSSVSAFWDYIETGAVSDRMRRMPPGARRELKQTLPRVEVPFVEFMVLDAMYQRIMAYPKLIQALKDSTLPFDLYKYVGEGNRRPLRFDNQLWLVEGLEIIRTALKLDRPLNLNRWSKNQKRKVIMEGYKELYMKPAPTRTNRDNELLKDLRSEGPLIKQPKRVLPGQRKKSEGLVLSVRMEDIDQPTLMAQTLSEGGVLGEAVPVVPSVQDKDPTPIDVNKGLTEEQINELSQLMPDDPIPVSEETVADTPPVAVQVEIPPSDCDPVAEIEKTVAAVEEAQAIMKKRRGEDTGFGTFHDAVMGTKVL